MRELEFLPSWYPQLRRRRRLLVIQLWATITLALGLMAWVAITDRTIMQKQGESRTLDRQLKQSRSDLDELAQMLDKKKSLEKQEQVAAQVGTHVEVSRLLALLNQIMPKEMSLTSASFDTEEKQVANDAKPAGKGSAAAEKTQTVSRTLVVHLHGVTPSDADWATVLAKLGNIPFFQNVQLEDAHEKTDQGHVMREFEVSCSIDLGDGQ